MHMELFELTRKLIDIPSVTGDEKAVGEFLKMFLEERQYFVKLQEVGPGRFNVVANVSSGAPPRVVFSTHMDTVPPYITSSEDEVRIYGRGACDAKGIIAAQIMAAERLRAEGIDELGLLFTVDEEMASLGAQVANQQKDNGQTSFLINGEPTDNKLAAATKGSLRVNIKTHGRAAHSAYPEQGESAIEKLLDVLADIRKCVWPTNDLLGETTCNIGVISGGTRPNVIPEAAEAVLQFRLVSGATPVRELLEQAIGKRAEVTYLSEHEPVYLHTVAGFEQCTVRFTTDIPYLSEWGVALLIGPGSILNAHTDHESVGKEELATAVDLYVRLAKALLAEVNQTETGVLAEGVLG